MKKQLSFTIISLASIILLSSFYNTFGEEQDKGVWICFNRAGYMPGSLKQVVVMAGKDLAGKKWRIETRKGKQVLSDTMSKSVCGITGHTPEPYNYIIDFSRLNKEGTYKLELDSGISVSFKIHKEPYAFIIPGIIRFLRAARSGTPDTLFHEASHLGDSKAILYRPKEGEPESGLWEKVPGDRTVDMLGGWYDAGDYIKFTLTTAYTTYFLLRSYEINPTLFTKKYSRSQLIDILDEAKFGLDYLVKTFPAEDVFIIQVSGREDHESGWRLPEKDSRDGKREALSAISPVHMGITSAALAVGARVFAKKGAKKEAKLYKSKAIAIYKRAMQPDALKTTAFEFNPNGGFSFYKDETLQDNMMLGAVELYKLTGSPDYLKTARSYPGKQGKDVYWGSLFLFANLALGEFDTTALEPAKKEAALYVSHAKNNIWGIPARYAWGSLANWSAIGSGLGLLYLQTGKKDADLAHTVSRINDYIFGTNNWGIVFFFTEKLPHSVRNIYSQLYRIKQVFPEGALSEGPAPRTTHERNQSYFKFKPEEQWTYRFNTAEVVFYDHETDFVTQESTIFGQASVLLFLTLLHTFGQ
jgi:hypothetical protein